MQSFFNMEIFQQNILFYVTVFFIVSLLHVIYLLITIHYAHDPKQTLKFA